MAGDSGLSGFDRFDPLGNGANSDDGGLQQFDRFDVQAGAVRAVEEADVRAFGLLVPDENVVAEVLAAREEAERRLLLDATEAFSAMAEDGTGGRGNIVGVGIAEKIVGGGPTGRVGVTVYVKEKLQRKSVSEEAVVPDEIAGVPTDVEAIGEVSAYMFTTRTRPLAGGATIGNCLQVDAGTMGCLVRRGNQLFILSNNHVLALVNTAPLDSPIAQPGRLDGGNCPDDIIARLSQFIPIALDNQCNYVDAAIARTSPDLVARGILRPNGINQPLTGPLAEPVLHLSVQKSGRTTQFRRGVVDAINISVNVSFAPIAGVARFCGQFRVKGIIHTPFSARGDSGALVTTMEGNRPVGLLFSGNAVTDVTFCNPISTVLSTLGVDLVL
jgi:hypothetical protein